MRKRVNKVGSCIYLQHVQGSLPKNGSHAAHAGAVLEHAALHHAVLGVASGFWHPVKSATCLHLLVCHVYMLPLICLLIADLPCLLHLLILLCDSKLR